MQSSNGVKEPVLFVNFSASTIHLVGSLNCNSNRLIQVVDKSHAMLHKDAPKEASYSSTSSATIPSADSLQWLLQGMKRSETYGSDRSYSI